MDQNTYAVAVDGPSGAGKSTLARALAEGMHRLGVLPKRFIRARDENDPSWGNPLTNAISFGLLL